MTRPATEDELAEAIRGANGPLRVVGGGTRGMAPGGEPLETGALSGVTLHEPGALTLVAQAGTPLAVVNETLREAGQCLPFEPMDHRPLLGTAGEPTIGGVVGGGVSGPRRVRAGACRDALIGVRLVTGEGRAVKSGGRVMKNVTGYDLAKLACGARGTLGVLTEVAFKVLPLPADMRTLAREVRGAPEAAALMSRALASPYEVTGAAWDGARVLLRVEGLEGSVAYRAGKLGDLVEAEPLAEDPWAAVRDAKAVAGAGDLWRVHVRPSDAPAVLDRVPHERALLDWGGGLVWLRTAPGTDVRALMGVPGHATCLRGAAPPLHPPAAGIAALEEGLRRRFDPRGLFRGGPLRREGPGAARAMAAP
ncbi:glycolate oxidase FAD binding subunit [Hasllibacter halocynthiae]|uniref:Glycolate oxidase FAD binding subunit n=1 Tax=Hasllibacter halocynthiae TaxID=595589 RepID=A0A2T0X1J0_9RHOB|nr:FAD-binding protein [Hasllibacter halocynthiae]PRY92724.1 glycolate oxidase FAD binding subunit [Hasllibacter halocynthiae]